MQIISYTVTLISITATIANAFQKRWCFIVWLFTNLFWIIYDLWIGAYGQALLYVANFVICVIGLVKWKKKERVYFSMDREHPKRYRKIRRVIFDRKTGKEETLEYVSFGRGKDFVVRNVFEKSLLRDEGTDNDKFE